VSKKWKVAIGVIIAAIVVSGIGLLGLGRVVYWNSGGERGWSPAAYISELVWGPGASAYIPKPGWGPAAHKGEAKVVTQLRCPEPCPEQSRRVVEGEVRLVDDDGDGVPDRGVIEAPTGLPFGRHFGPGHGSRFGPGHGPHFGRGFGLFLIIGGLFRLAFLALLIGLAVACFYRWRRAKETREPQ